MDAKQLWFELMKSSNFDSKYFVCVIKILIKLIIITITITII